MLPRSRRLTREHDLRTVAREGKRIRTPHLEIRAAASLLRHPRIGVIVPKYKRGSVARNRLKRRLREIIRMEILPGLASTDVVVRARPEAYEAPFNQLRMELVKARDRLPAIRAGS